MNDLTAPDVKRMRKQYPDKVPVWVERSTVCTSLPDIAKHKFLVPQDMTCAQLAVIIRRHIRMNAEQALFLRIGNRIPPMNEPLSALHARCMEPSGFLKVVYIGENTFGGDQPLSARR